MRSVIIFYCCLARNSDSVSLLYKFFWFRAAIRCRHGKPFLIDIPLIPHQRGEGRQTSRKNPNTFHRKIYQEAKLATFSFVIYNAEKFFILFCSLGQNYLLERMVKDFFNLRKRTLMLWMKMVHNWSIIVEEGIAPCKTHWTLKDVFS